MPEVALDFLADEFLRFITVEKGLSHNTIEAYSRDLKKFLNFLFEKEISEIGKIDKEDIRTFLYRLNTSKMAIRSRVRCLTALRMFFKFLLAEQYVTQNPTALIDLPKIQKKIPSYLSFKEVEDLLQAPDRKDFPLGLRDSAMLELLYATGLRVSELVSLQIPNLNMIAGYITALGKGDKERIVLMGKTAKSRLEEYLEHARPRLLKDNTSNMLFLSKTGKPLSRVDFWKIIKKYAQASNINKPLSPHTLRHCFATHMLEKGADLIVLKNLLGHADISSTEIYTHVNRDYLAKLYQKHHPRA